MPIEFRIDHELRLVLARGLGTITDRDVFGYQRSVWSRSDVAGYDEFVDMTGTHEIRLPEVGRVKDLAAVSAAMDMPSSPSRFAIVAPDDLAYGLGRMYETYRGHDPRSTKTVAVFRTLPEAALFLGVNAELLRWNGPDA